MKNDNAERPRRLAVIAAAGTVLAWGSKAAVMAAAGGLDRSPLEGPLFLIGFVLLVFAFVAAGVGAFSGRGPAPRVLAGIGAAVIGVVLFVLVETGVGALVPESAGWVKEEAGLWVVSVLTALLLAAGPLRRRSKAAATA